MTAPYIPTGDVDAHLDALQHGADLAITKRREKATARDAIWHALMDALDVMKSGPNRERAWLRGGSSTTAWSRIGLTRAEALALGKLRALSSVIPWDRPTVVSRISEEDRAMLVLEWLRWLDRYPDALALHQAVKEVLRGDPYNRASSIYRPGRKHSRQTVSEIKRRTTDAIVVGLRQSFSIIPGHGCTWVSIKSEGNGLGFDRSQALVCKSKTSLP